MKKEKKFSSPTKQKVLLLLQAGVVLALSSSPRKQVWIFKKLAKEWVNVDRQYLYRIMREFKYERLVDWEEKKDGSLEIILTEKGKKWALRFNINNMKIKKPPSWNGKWWVVFYDIPEKRKNAREALRNKLKDLGFYELQKSILVFPYPCKNEIDFIVEFFKLRNFIHYGEILNLSNDAKLKIYFNL